VVCSSAVKLATVFSMRFLFLLILLMTLQAEAGQDDDFLAARDAFRAGNARQLATLAMRLKDTQLEVYAAYYQLRLNLDTADAGSVREFLARPADTPLIDRMRAEWLKSLGKRQQWELFDSEYPRLKNPDVELTCYALQSGMRHQNASMLSQAHDLWLSAKEMPESCDIPFDAAIAAGAISQQDIWDRLRMVLEAGNVTLAKSLSARLSGKLAISAVALDRAINNPGRYLEKAPLTSKGQRMVALFALLRQARQSPDIAISRWDKIEKHFSEQERSYFYGWLAYEAARKHDARALQWYALAQDAPLNDQQRAWRVRAALRAKDWGGVLSGIGAMTSPQQNETTWRYWKARALQAVGRPLEASEIFVPLSAEHTFYGELAREEISRTPVLSVAQSPFQPDKKELEDMEKLPGVQRAIALYRMDLRTDALREWNWTIRNFSDQQLLVAAEVARRHEMYDRAINTADKTLVLHDFSLRYLAPYRSVMRQHIRENDLDEAWVYGLMRQESRFVTSARSGVGATGLMQIMPTTARWIARKLGLRDYRAEFLEQLDTNLLLGMYYMKNMLTSLEGSPVLASAAYNAGPGRARRWRADAPMEGAIYVETIPFDETRDYVKKVMSNTMYYAQEFGTPALSLKARLGIIGGSRQDAADDRSSLE
jgi:soluble lytic murein transglycosylase